MPNTTFGMILIFWKHCSDQIIRRCVVETEFHSILTFCHSYACLGHFGPKRTAMKVLDSGFYWPTIFKDAYFFCKSCDRCQRTGNLGATNQMPQTYLLLRFLMYGVWISWDIFLLLLVIFIFYLLLIMFQRGWKQKPLGLGLMIQKLFQIL